MLNTGRSEASLPGDDGQMEVWAQIVSVVQYGVQSGLRDLAGDGGCSHPPF